LAFLTPNDPLVLALPKDLCTPERLQLTSGRVKIIDILPSEQHTHMVIQRYLMTATHGNIAQIEQLCHKALFEQLNSFILQEYVSHNPGAWVKLLKIILEIANHWIAEGKKLPLPLEVEEKSEKKRVSSDKEVEEKLEKKRVSEDVVREYCRHHLPLRKAIGDNRLGVWRGHRWIKLDRASYEFLMLLFRSKGHPVDYVHTQTKKSNLHTLARRLRVAIEPVPSNPVYVHNKREEGYWLEHFK
jgi:hypothetical protein